MRPVEAVGPQGIHLAAAKTGGRKAGSIRSRVSGWPYKLPAQPGKRPVSPPTCSPHSARLPSRQHPAHLMGRSTLVTSSCFNAMSVKSMNS